MLCEIIVKEKFVEATGRSYRNLTLLFGGEEYPISVKQGKDDNRVVNRLLCSFIAASDNPEEVGSDD